MNKLFEKKWLEQNIFYSQLDENKLKHVFYFPILWNIFEKNFSKICENKIQIGKYKIISQTIYNNKIDINKINQIYDYFKNRYIKNKDRFLSLSFRKDIQTEQNIKQEIIKRFKKAKIDDIEKIEVILCIAFRIRNNLYHGIKKVDKLYEQNENFKQINNFLILAIEGHKNDN